LGLRFATPFVDGYYKPSVEDSPLSYLQKKSNFILPQRRRERREFISFLKFVICNDLMDVLAASAAITFQLFSFLAALVTT
jgi:transposase